jgi:hypothetical protein
MNTRSAQSAHLESRRWWWPSAVAGVAASAAIAAIAVVPIAGHAMPVEGTHPEAPGTFFPATRGTFEPAGTDTETGRPCFMTRHHWNVAIDWHQPACPRTRSTSGHGAEDQQASPARPNAALGV